MKTYLEPEPVQGSFRWLHSHTWIQRWLTAAHRRRACIGMHCPALSACRIQLLFQLSLHPSPSTPLLPPLLPYFPLSVPPSPFPLPPALPHPLASCSIPSLAHLLSAGLCSNHIGASFSNHIILTLAFPSFLPLPWHVSMVSLPGLGHHCGHCPRGAHLPPLQQGGGGAGDCRSAVTRGCRDGGTQGKSDRWRRSGRTALHGAMAALHCCAVSASSGAGVRRLKSAQHGVRSHGRCACSGGGCVPRLLAGALAVRWSDL